MTTNILKIVLKNQKQKKNVNKEDTMKKLKMSLKNTPRN